MVMENVNFIPGVSESGALLTVPCVLLPEPEDELFPEEEPPPPPPQEARVRDTMPVNNRFLIVRVVFIKFREMVYG